MATLLSNCKLRIVDCKLNSRSTSDELSDWLWRSAARLEKKEDALPETLNLQSSIYNSQFTIPLPL
jgi:hypothetical protein